MNLKWSKLDREMKKRLSFKWIRKQGEESRLGNSRKNRRKGNDKMKRERDKRWTRTRLNKGKELKKCLRGNKKRLRDKDY